MKPEVSVCIATYKRPELLRLLLVSLFAQETGDEFTFSIIVADNDALRSAEGVVREFEAEGRRIIYGVEPEQSISLARNKSLSFATGDYIAITDDDAYADRRWLLNHFLAISSLDADVVHGPVISEFPSQTPRYIRECHIFNRPNPPTGSTEMYTFVTANTFFRRKLINGVASPFDPRFGRTGGEDTEFFRQLKNRGCRMIWCRDALVYEPVPPGRANLTWVLKRDFRYGNNRFTHSEGVDSVDNHKRFILYRGLVKIIKALIHLCTGLFNIICGVFDKEIRDKGIDRLLSMSLSFAHFLGTMARYVNIHYEEYRGE